MRFKYAKLLCGVACAVLLGSSLTAFAQEYTSDNSAIEAEYQSEDVSENAEEVESEGIDIDDVEQEELDGGESLVDTSANQMNFNLSSKSTEKGTYRTIIKFENDKKEYSYTTKRIKPKVVLTYRYYATDAEIAEGAPETTDTIIDPSLYTVTYTDNKNVGTAKATVTGIHEGYTAEKLKAVEGDTCTGKRSIKFEIKKASVKKLSVKLSKTKYAYNGKERKPSVTIKNNDVLLIKNIDYTVTYKNNIKIGTATAVIKGKGSKYCGTLNCEYQIKIAKVKNMEAAGKSYNKIKTKWSSLTKVDGYQVYRSETKTGGYKKVKTVKSGTLAVYDETADYRVKYYYKTRGYVKQDGKVFYGACSDPDAAITKEIVAPQSVSATYKTLTTCKVNWSLVDGADGYQIYYCDKKDGTFTKYGTISSGSTVSKTVTDLEGGVLYYFKVRAYRLSGTTKLYTSFSSIVKEVKTNTYENVGDDRLAELFPNGVPTTEAQMKKYLVTISIPIISDKGVKGTHSITIHTALKAKFTSVFTDLYKAKFPVRASDTAGYVWRSMATSSKRSHHSYGCVVDLNWGSNPMISSSGANITSGYYRPGKDPYSVTEECINIWKKYGFYWGGDWNSSKDYMHFTYTNH